MNKLSEKVMKDFLKTKSVEQIHFDKLQEKGLDVFTLLQYDKVSNERQSCFFVMNH